MVHSRAKKKDHRRAVFKQIFLCLLLAGFIFFIYSLLVSFKRAVWSGENQLNFVVQTDKIRVFSYQPQTEVLNILTIDNKIHLPVARGFGDYPISSISFLGEQEGIGGGELLKLSLQGFLAVPVDGYIVQKQKAEENSQDQSLEEANLLPLFYCLLKNRCQTNFTAKDLVVIGLNFSRLKVSQIKTFDFKQTGVVRAEVLPDQSKILKPDQAKIDQLSVKFFADSQVLEEGVTVSLYNSTSKSGLAQEVGRLVRNLGAEVINTGNVGEEISQSVIYYKNEKIKESYTLARLVEVFALRKIEEDQEQDVEIKFVLGEDIKSFF